MLKRLKQVKEENKALHQVMKISQVKGFSSALIYESDLRTKFYTGLPIYSVFTALVTSPTQNGKHATVA